MNFKHPLFYTGTIILIIEIVCLILMPDASATEILNDETVKGSYIPYMIAMLTGSFLAAILFLIAGVIFILKSSIKKNVPALLSLLMSFIIPMIVYYSLFD